MQRAQQIFHVQNADDVLRVAAPERQPRHRRGDDRIDNILGLIVGVERDHVGAVDHDVGDHQIAQIEHAAEHVTVERLHIAFAVQQVDGAAQLLARRQHLLILADRHADELEQPAHQRFDRHQQRAEQSDEPVHRPRHRERDAVGRVERRRFRQDLGEHDDQDRHDERGVDHADIAKQGQQKVGRQHRGCDVDRIVAEQQRAEQPLALLEQAVDDAGASCFPASPAAPYWHARMR